METTLYKIYCYILYCSQFIHMSEKSKFPSLLSSNKVLRFPCGSDIREGQLGSPESASILGSRKPTLLWQWSPLEKPGLPPPSGGDEASFSFALRECQRRPSRETGFSTPLGSNKPISTWHHSRPHRGTDKVPLPLPARGLSSEA